jgi:hypothetical protein
MERDEGKRIMSGPEETRRKQQIRGNESGTRHGAGKQVYMGRGVELEKCGARRGN